DRALSHGWRRLVATQSPQATKAHDATNDDLARHFHSADLRPPRLPSANDVSEENALPRRETQHRESKLAGDLQEAEFFVQTDRSGIVRVGKKPHDVRSRRQPL